MKILGKFFESKEAKANRLAEDKSKRETLIKGFEDIFSKTYLKHTKLKKQELVENLQQELLKFENAADDYLKRCKEDYALLLILYFIRNIHYVADNYYFSAPENPSEDIRQVLIPLRLMAKYHECAQEACKLFGDRYFSMGSTLSIGDALDAYEKIWNKLVNYESPLRCPIKNVWRYDISIRNHISSEVSVVAFKYHIPHSLNALEYISTWEK